jgi:flagellar protein FliS
MTYNRYLEARILSADPVELVHIVYEHALDMIRCARRSLAEGDIPGRSKAICRTIDAVSELDASLNRAQGGEISRNLAGLYRYMRARLTEANLHQQDAPLAEVEGLLATLAEPWRALCGQPSAPAAESIASPAARMGNWSGAVTPEPQVEFAGHSWSV